MTKIVLTGATGLVGGQVLKTAIADSRITSIIVLSRRDLSIKNAKLTTVVHKDFQKYPPELIAQLKGATAIIWCIGGMVRDFDNAEIAREVQVTYALNAAEAVRDSGVLPVRFVFCSGAFAEREQSKKLRWIGDTRKIKGEAEAGLLKIAESTEGFETYCMRLGGVMPANIGGRVAASLLSWSGLVAVEQVARVFIDVALNGAKKDTFENSDIVKYKVTK